MSVQFIGMIGHRLASEIIPPAGPIFDKQYIADFTKNPSNRNGNGTNRKGIICIERHDLHNGDNGSIS